MIALARLPKRTAFLILAVFCWFPQTAWAVQEDSPRLTPMVKVVNKCSRSVVNINTENLTFLAKESLASPYQSFFEETSKTVPLGTVILQRLGSGVILSPDGLILTNAHIIQTASKIYVSLANKKQAEAKPVSVNSVLDLALIKLDVPYELVPVEFASDIAVGETVVAIGNALGLPNSVSVGVVSGKNREIPGMPENSVFKDLIQIDASLNQGDSGGGLFNLEGKFMGINLAMVQSAEGVGFAIPFTRVREALEEYKRQAGVKGLFQEAIHSPEERSQ